MRLTLRTMLAYLDDILEPADRDEIGRKIEESEFAKQLVSRVRESTHKTRLGAPKLTGKGLGSDANTVAEYLDNTLSGERVPDFEKVCLESDTHLAEVAASHQILTMVLGQPVDVDPAMKRRMYGIVRHPEAPRPIEAVAAPGDRFPPNEDGGIIPNRHREVPDYLRQRVGASKWRTIVAAIALLVLLCGAITMALGPLDRTNPIARWLGIGQQPANQVAQNTEAAKQPAAAPSTEQTPPAASSETTTEHGTPPIDTAEKSAAASTPAASTPPANPEPEASQPPAAIASLPNNTDTTKASSSPISGHVPAAEMPALPPAGSAVTPTQPNNAATAAPLPSDPGRAAPLAPQNQPGVISSSTEPAAAAPSPAAMPQQGAAPAAAQAAPAAQPDVLVGRLLPGKGTILLKLDPASGQWNRLAAGSPLSGSDKLMVLPTFRPTLTLSSGLTLQVPSETLLELAAPDGGGTPGVKLHFGRLVLMTTGQSGAKLRLDLGANRGVLSFTDAEATVGVEVRRYHMPGIDPEAQEPRIAADLYAVSGRVQWTPEDGGPTLLTAPQRFVVAPHPLDPANGDAGKLIPKWISSEQLIPLNALAADDLVKTISDDKRPLQLELQEMADSRRIECRSLAVQCLALLDQFEPLVTALNDPDEHPVWPVQINSVRSALARGPHTAAKVREAFQKQRGEDDGKQLDRMLWGYTREQLQDGEAAKLVGYLSNDSLDYRVLAFADLHDITGATFDYRPDTPAVTREGRILRWQDLLKRGLIVPKEPASVPASSVPPTPQPNTTQPR